MISLSHWGLFEAPPVFISHFYRPQFASANNLSNYQGQMQANSMASLLNQHAEANAISNQYHRLKFCDID